MFGTNKQEPGLFFNQVSSILLFTLPLLSMVMSRHVLSFLLLSLVFPAFAVKFTVKQQSKSTSNFRVFAASENQTLDIKYVPSGFAIYIDNEPPSKYCPGPHIYGKCEYTALASVFFLMLSYNRLRLAERVRSDVVLHHFFSNPILEYEVQLDTGSSDLWIQGATFPLPNASPTVSHISCLQQSKTNLSSAEHRI